jgi:hypothetical protein
MFKFFYVHILACSKNLAKSSQKLKKMFKFSYIHILACSQIWLNLPMDDHHFGYITKLTLKKKRLHVANK